MSQVGKVYLVGAGPGDPGLITLKGVKCLAEADLVLYDGLVNPLILRHTNATAERTSRVQDSTGPKLNQAQINQRLVQAGLEGKTVVRLKGGDPFIFGRGSEEAAALAAAGIPYEVVPGITAATAASEYAGISLTHRDLASAVAFVTGHEDPQKPASSLDYQELAKFPGTLVFYMGLHRIQAIAEELSKAGKSATTPVAVISRGSTAFQKTVTGTLADIATLVSEAELKAPSLIIVGECVSQRSKINWFEQLPLAGKTIGITRPEGHADNAIDRTFELGAQAVLMPTIDIQPLTDWTCVDETINRLAEYDWLIFTSVIGVDAFLKRLWETGGDARKLSQMKLACIGPATALRLEQYHLRADVVPETYRAEALADALAPHVANQRVLWACASRGRDVLPTVLREAGATFERVVVYEHHDVEEFPADVHALIAAHELDWIGLSSPSIARNVARILQQKFGSLKTLPIKFAAISPVTEQAAIEVGLPITIVAQTHTWDGIFEAILSSEQ